VDRRRAKWELAYLRPTLIVDNVAHGQALRDALTIRPPTILVAPSNFERVAA
jgi:hypothetical protein